jgi:hypothetical protein
MFQNEGGGNVEMHTKKHCTFFLQLSTTRNKTAGPQVTVALWYYFPWGIHELNR